MGDLQALLQHHRTDAGHRRGRQQDDQAVSAEELLRAITEDQFLLHYQPQLEIAKGYLFSRPLAVPDLVVWLGQRACAAGA
jgi:EAL domain-containing protein (putative c-di-GMP-specific phosphodiesterase class I)